MRDYGLPPSVWGGDEAHEHDWKTAPPRRERHASDVVNWESKQATNKGANRDLYPTESCSCGAWRGTLGLEPTPELYVEHMVEVFREVWRVLKKDGVVFLNMGDSFAGAWGNYGGQNRGHGSHGSHAWDGLEKWRPPNSLNHRALKPKDLCGIPWRVAFALQGFAVVPFRSFSAWAGELRAAREAQDWEAVGIVEGKLQRMDLLAALQADGWWLRGDIIWSKPNPMPESVTDRPTRAHEYVFLLTKAATYYYDADAMREPSSEGGWAKQRAKGFNTWEYNDTLERIAQTGQRIEASTFGRAGGRNRRDVWTIPSEQTPESHFAVFPEKLVEPCILAGTSEKGECVECGKNWIRDIAVGYDVQCAIASSEKSRSRAQGNSFATRALGRARKLVAALGWRPTCACKAPTRPNLVLDCFLGSGTVGVVAERFGRRWVGLELSQPYIEIAKRRTAQRGLFFA